MSVKNYFVSTIGCGLAFVVIEFFVMGDFTDCGECIFLILGGWLLGTFICGILNLTYFLNPRTGWGNTGDKYLTLLLLTLPSIIVLLYFKNKFSSEKLIEFNSDTVIYYSCFGANFLFGLWTWLKTQTNTTEA
jgi:hypothetical protein